MLGLMPTPHPFHPGHRLGLTGSIASGKSRVAALLRARGLSVLDADAEAHAASREPDVLAEVAGQLGAQYVQGGALNRPALAQLVFHDPAQRQVLNSILHPRVRARMAAAEAAVWARGETWVVQDIPLLLETGQEGHFDALLLVDAPYPLRLARAVARDGLSPEAFAARDAAQMPPDEKRRRVLAHPRGAVLDNGGTPDELERRVEHVLADWAIGRLS